MRSKFRSLLEDAGRNLILPLLLNGELPLKVELPLPGEFPNEPVDADIKKSSPLLLSDDCMLMVLVGAGWCWLMVFVFEKEIKS